jgi:hypothetical protein
MIVDDELGANCIDGFAGTGEPLIGVHANILGDDTAKAHGADLLDLQAGRAGSALGPRIQEKRVIGRQGSQEMASGHIPLECHLGGKLQTARVVALAAGFLATTSYEFTVSSLIAYVQAFQQSTVLRLVELWALVPALKLVLLEEIAARGSKVAADPAGSYGAGVCVRSLRDIGQTSWKEVLEPLVLFDRILRQDSAGAYARMDFESRDLYRTEVANIAEHSDLPEGDVATAALALARSAHQETHASPRLTARLGHIGYYLLAEGSASLHGRVGFQPPLGQRVGSFLRRHPDEFYLPATEVLTLALMSAIVLLLTNTYTSPALILFSMVMLLLPCSQSAIQLVNYLITSLLEPKILPKLDFSEGVPDNCTTLVAIPSLLFSQEQVRRLVEDLEVRFLGNHDPNIHFALLTEPYAKSMIL